MQDYILTKLSKQDRQQIASNQSLHAMIFEELGE
jgi:hypothetical protein